MQSFETPANDFCTPLTKKIYNSGSRPLIVSLFEHLFEQSIWMLDMKRGHSLFNFFSSQNKENKQRRRLRSGWILDHIVISERGLVLVFNTVSHHKTKGILNQDPSNA
jgi:hypothetical protein